jgi:uncharacterized membrane protein
MMPRWLVWCLLALLFFGGWAAAPNPKALSREYSGSEVQMFSTVGLLPILAVLCFSKKLRQGTAKARRKGAAIAFLAGVLAVAGNIAYYQALRRGGSAMTVAPLTALYPLVTVLLALVFLGEKPHPVQIAGIPLALAAIYAFNPPQQGAEWRSIDAFVLLPIGLYGVAGLLQKVSTDHASGELSSLWFQAAFLPAAAVIYFIEGGTGDLPARDWAVLTLVGLCFGLGNVALLASFASGGKASIVTPISGLYSVVAIPLAMLLGERAGMREATGIALALVAVVMLSWERKKEIADVGQAS